MNFLWTPRIKESLDYKEKASCKWAYYNKTFIFDFNLPETHSKNYQKRFAGRQYFL